MPATDPDYLLGSQDRAVRPPATQPRLEVITPISPVGWMPRVADFAPRFDLVDVATLGPAADPALRKTRKLMELIEEGKVDAVDDHGTLRVDPRRAADQLKDLGYKQVHPLDASWVPPGTPAPGDAAHERLLQKLKDAMPKPTPEERRAMVGDHPGVTTLNGQPFRGKGPGIC